VANTTRDDGREFIDIAARIPVRTSVLVYPFDQVNNALIALKHDAIRGAMVISIF
jgi:alcohol dehydrogenase, propanol-preferring